MSLAIAFDNSYARLPQRLFMPQVPAPVAAPRLLALNRPLAEELGLDPDALASADGVAMLAGNQVADGAEPLAQAYAGHQFGVWVPRLGDGRAVLLGEVVDRHGRRHDLQLKGAGRTPFSRGGDGRAWMGPVLREYLVSEAMAALGVPTTRALAAVATGETVLRDEGPMPGAVLTRVAASHIRVGTFQYLAARKDLDGLKALVAHVLARHYPQADGALGLLQAVTDAQARLVAAWMSLGFVHGVMNTDNMAVSGETIDYGPCAFLDGYDPAAVFSSIDRFGRYAYRNQPQIAVWNLAQLATALLPLLGGEEAIPKATAVIESFADTYQGEWARLFRAKLGLSGPAAEGDCGLCHRLLAMMAAAHADFTVTFRALAEQQPTGLEALPEFVAWHRDWEARLADESDPFALMRRSSPAIIPRNHRVEQVISAALDDDLAPFRAFSAALAAPFSAAADSPWRTPPAADERVTRTFCGT